MKFKKKPHVYDPKRDLLDENLIAEAVWECLEEDDPEGVIEVLESHFRAKDNNLKRT